MHQELDNIVRESLTAFINAMFAMNWIGREREAISLYVLGYLGPLCAPGKFLRDPTQIGIEVAVPQLPGPRRKRQVTRDVVIWNEPGMSCWNRNWEPIVYPAAILEWKVFRAQSRGSAKVSKDDIDWLCQFSVGRQDFVGYAVTVDRLSRRFRLMCTRVQDGQSVHEWLCL